MKGYTFTLLRGEKGDLDKFELVDLVGEAEDESVI